MVERVIRTFKEQCAHRQRFETLQHASHTRKLARVHQFNRVIRKYLHRPCVSPGQSPRLDAIKAPIGWLLAVARHVLLRQLYAFRALRSGTRPVEGWWGEKAPPGSF